MPKMKVSQETPPADVTVVMHTYNRPAYFEHYVGKGLWDEVPLLVVDDGSDEGVVARLREAAASVGGSVVHYEPNQGVARATAVGIENTPTAHFMLVGDDDYFVDYQAFAAAAAAVLAEDEGVLLVTMPRVFYLEARTGHVQLKYDRRKLDGIKGETLLREFVREGELHVFQAGAMMRRADVEGLLADPFFRTSEDFALLSRLCARFPERKVRVMDEGAYVRLMHRRSLSAKASEDHGQYVTHLVSLFVGARHWIDRGGASPEEFRDLLEARGARLRDSVGFGREAARLLGRLLAGVAPEAGSEEAAFTLAFLREHREGLPGEFMALMPEPSLHVLAEEEGPGMEGHPAAAGGIEPGVTILMPTYNRTEHLEEHTAAGHWDGVNLLLVDDGSDADVAARLDALAEAQGFRVHHLPENKGVSHAIAAGFGATSTSHVALVGDDDYCEELDAFLAEAQQIYAEHGDVLLVAMPVMYMREGERLALQYDRKPLAGMTGRDLLMQMVKEGEMQALGAGAVYEVHALEDIGPDAFFRMAGDFALLARHCARYPERKVYVAGSGRYVRLLHHESITARTATTVEKIVMHLVSLLVGARHLVALGEIGLDSVRRHLKRRGQVLKLTYEHGQDTAQVMSSLLEGEQPEVSSPEARAALAFLREQADELPREFKALLPGESKAFLQQEAGTADAADAPEADGFSRMASLTGMVAALQEKRYDVARALIEGHKARHPNDDELPTIEATVALAGLDVEGAIRVLCDALVRNPEHFGHLFMLGNVLIQIEAYETAMRLYARAARIGGKDERATLEEGLDRLAENGVTEPVPTPRVAFVVKAGMGHFLDDLMRELVLDFEVRTFIYRGAADVDAALRWGDVCWFEWCNEPLVYASRHPLALQKKIVCRLHRYEAFSAYPMQVKWANVDRLIFVADHVKLIVEHTVPGLGDLVETEVISNGVDTERYTWKERTPGFNLAYVGYLHLRKNPMLLLQILAKLVAVDPRYQLHIAGVYQDPLLRLYWTHAVREMGLDAHVHLDGWQEDIDAWLQDKDYILSSSLHESFGYAIAEAMTCGIKPVIHHFPFASEIWPEEVLFNTVDEAVAQITEAEYNSALYQHFIRRKYGLEEQVVAVRRLLQGLAAPAAQPMRPAPPSTEAADPEPEPGAAALDAAGPNRAESMYEVSRQMLARSADRLVQERVKVA